MNRLHAPVFARGLCLLASAFLVTLGGLLPRAHAAIPAAARADALFAKGYLVATYYPNIHNDGANAADTTAGLNEALADAYAENVVLYLPPGVYLVNDTLLARTYWRSDVNNDPTVPHLAMVGSTVGGGRPLIRLDVSAVGFGNAGSPKAVVEFLHYDDIERNEERPAAAYYQLLRNVDVDCGGHAGAIGVYFNQAQDSSVENVRVDATGAFAGFKGLPSRAWGAVNIEVEGGQYGIDTDTPPNNSAGSCIAGVVLRNQTVSAIRHTGFATTVVGFEIVTMPGATTAALTIAQRSSAAHTSNLSLVDGVIRLSPGFAGPAAVSNPNTRSIYLRNVYVTGGTNLVKSGANAIRTAAGAWSRIDEYSYCNQGTAAAVRRETWDLIDGVASRAPGPLNNGEVSSITDNAAPPPADLVSRHVWASLPTVDDTDYYDPVAQGDIAPGNVSRSVLQAVIDSHPKVFLPKGVYKLDGTIVLNSDTVLFGAARHLTRLEVQNGWAPGTTETPIVTTVSDPTATTYLGDLAIGVPRRNAFAAVDWQAGANSMIHIARPYDSAGTTANNARSLYRSRNDGGGRWYFPGSGESIGTNHAGYRILNVEGTTQPLWIYGLDIEHAQGAISAEFSGASNVRIYQAKSEHYPFGTRGKTFFSFRDAQNIALFGHAALSAAPQGGYYDFEYVGQTDRVLATLMIPNDSNGTGPSLYENITSVPGPNSIAHPRGIALYKRGTITAADEAAMSHAPIAYASLPAGWQRADIGAVQAVGSSYSGSDTFTLIGSGHSAPGTGDEQQFAYQAITGDRSLTARVTTQDASATAAAGVTIRAGTQEDAAFLQLVATAGGTLRLRSRAAAGQPVNQTDLGSATATPWLRVTRSGEVLVAYYSTDMVTWVEAGLITADLGGTAYFGLAATSGEDGALHAATFDEVSLMTPPTIDAPAAIVAEATGPGGAVVTYNAVATDFLSEPVPVVASVPSGSLFPLGTTTVRLNATDLEGFTAVKFLRVTVLDTTGPAIISLTPSVSSLWPANHKMVPVSIAAIVYDPVDPAPVTQILSVSSSEPEDGLGDGDTAPDWEITGPLSLKLRAERSGTGPGRVYTITVASTDVAGNISTATTTVTVPHSNK